MKSSSKTNDCNQNRESSVFEVLINRSSLRNFRKKIIKKEILKKIITAGIRAPNSGNLQPYSIIVSKDKMLKEQLAKSTGQNFIVNADTLLFFLLDFYRLKLWAKNNDAPFVMEKSFRHFLTGVHDLICCAQNVVIASESMGIGSVFIGKVIELYDDLKKRLNLPELTFPLALLCLGYPESKIRNICKIFNI